MKTAAKVTAVVVAAAWALFAAVVVPDASAGERVFVGIFNFLIAVGITLLAAAIVWPRQR